MSLTQLSSAFSDAKISKKPQPLLDIFPSVITSLLSSALTLDTAEDASLICRTIDYLLSCKEGQTMLQNLCLSHADFMRVLVKHDLPQVRAAVGAVLGTLLNDEPTLRTFPDVITTLFLDRELSVHNSVKRAFSPNKLTLLYESLLVTDEVEHTLLTHDERSLRLIESFCVQPTTMMKFPGVSKCLLTMLLSEDVLLRVSAMEVFCDVALQAPTVFLLEKQLPAVINNLLQETADLTVLSFVFRFVGKIASIGGGSLLLIEHGWLETILAFLVRNTDRMDSFHENLFTSGISAVGYTAITVEGNAHIRTKPAMIKSLRELWQRECCDRGRTSQVAASMALAAYEAFGNIICGDAAQTSSSMLTVLFSSPSDPLWLKSVELGPTRRNSEVRWGYLTFIQKVLMTCGTIAIEYVLAGSQVSLYWMNLDAEQDPPCVEVRNAVLIHLGMLSGTEPWISLATKCTLVQGAPKVGLSAES